MAVRADMISNRRRVQRALQAVGFVALLTLAVGVVLTASGAFAGGLGASSVKPAYAPILTDTTDTPTSTSTPIPCDPGWSLVSSPNPPGDFGLALLHDVAVVSANDVWAVGYYNPDSGPTHTLVEHWNGISWSVVPSPNAGTYQNRLYGVAVVSANDVWAVGSYDDNFRTLVEHWDGTSWSVVPSPNGTPASVLNDIAVVTANDVWAVGYSGNSTLTEHWDGTSWSVIPSPNPGTCSFCDNHLNGVASVSANDVWAVGYYYNGGANQTLIEHWDGTSWSVVPSPNVGTDDNHLFGVAAVSANDVWAVGYYRPGGNYHTLVEHWDSTSWSVVSSPNDGIQLYEVAAVSAKDVWAVGNNGNVTLIDHWDGTSWQRVSSPNPGCCIGSNFLYGVAAASANDVWAVGQSNVNTTLVEHYAPICPTPTTTPTTTPTNTPTPGPNIINGHLTWQGVAPANRLYVTGTLQLCVNGSTQTFNITTDTDGKFTVNNTLPDGTYHWRIKGGRHLSRSSPADGAALVITNGYATLEFGTQRGGDAYSDNIVNATDYNTFHHQFGIGGIWPGDFDYNYMVNILDFNILKTNFGQAGHTLTCP